MAIVDVACERCTYFASNKAHDLQAAGNICVVTERTILLIITQVSSSAYKINAQVLQIQVLTFIMKSCVAVGPICGCQLFCIRSGLES